MFAMITTEEYKELIKATESEKVLLVESKEVLEKLKETEDNLKELLLLLMKGETRPRWVEAKYEWMDIADKEAIAKFINDNYLWNGELQFEKVKENDDEQVYCNRKKYKRC